jgi:hypothetical protein
MMSTARRLPAAVRLDQVALQHQAAAVLHQGMAHEAQHRPCSGRLLAEPHVRVGGRGLGDAGSLSAPEADLGIAVLVVGAWHGVGLGVVLGGLVFCGGVVSGRITRTIVMRWRTHCLRLDALHRGPGLDQRGVHREMRDPQERRRLAMRQD